MTRNKGAFQVFLSDRSLWPHPLTGREMWCAGCGGHFTEPRQFNDVTDVDGKLTGTCPLCRTVNDLEALRPPR